MPAKIKDLVKEASAAIELRNAQTAFAKLKESVADHGGEETLAEIRRLGCFRGSNYDYETETMEKVVLAVRSAFPAERQDYFDSVLALIWLSQTARGLVKEARRRFDRDDVKSFLVALEFLFLGYGPRSNDDDDNYQGHSKEMLCSAFSYLYFLLTRNKAVTPTDLDRIKFAGIKNLVIYGTLADIASVLQLRNAELLVDAYDYTAKRDGSSCFVKARAADFEKSVRLGNILHETQQFVASRVKFGSRQAMSVFETGSLFAERFEGELVRIVDEPYRRVVAALPVMVKAFKEMFGTGTAFAEDLTLKHTIQKELLLNPDLYRRPVLERVSALDISTLQRLFIFVSAILYAYCNRRGILFGKLHATSQLRVFRTENISLLLTELFDAERAAAMLRLLKWAPTSGDYFDLQYQPFISAGDFYAIPTAITGFSALTRNLLMKHKVRYDSESEDDPVGDRLEAAAKKQFPSVHRAISYRWSESGEIDLFIVGKECVFAFECKNTIHPSSPFELRGAFQQLNESVQQLNRLKRFYPDVAFREYLRECLGVFDPLPSVLHVCTVSGVRTFAGLIWHDVPTRPLWELCNFLNTGIITLKAARADQVESIAFRLWENENFAESDLVDALGPDSFWNLRLNAMEEVFHTYALRGKSLNLVTYAVNLSLFLDHVSRRYTVLEKSDEDAADVGTD